MTSKRDYKGKYEELVIEHEKLQMKHDDLTRLIRVIYNRSKEAYEEGGRHVQG